MKTLAINRPKQPAKIGKEIKLDEAMMWLTSIFVQFQFKILKMIFLKNHSNNEFFSLYFILTGDYNAFYQFLKYTLSNSVYWIKDIFIQKTTENQLIIKIHILFPVTLNGFNLFYKKPLTPLKMLPTPFCLSDDVLIDSNSSRFTHSINSFSVKSV